MTINITKWSPDTCKCVLHYSWDDTEVVPEGGNRTHTPIDSYDNVHGEKEKTVYCELHSKYKGKLHEHHNVVIAHNRDPQNQTNKHLSVEEHTKRGMSIDHLKVAK